MLHHLRVKSIEVRSIGHIHAGRVLTTCLSDLTQLQKNQTGMMKTFECRNKLFHPSRSTHGRPSLRWCRTGQEQHQDPRYLVIHAGARPPGLPEFTVQRSRVTRILRDVDANHADSQKNRARFLDTFLPTSDFYAHRTASFLYKHFIYRRALLPIISNTTYFCNRLYKQLTYFI